MKGLGVCNEKSNNRKIEGLREMARRAGTVAEQRLAQAVLTKGTLWENTLATVTPQTEWSSNGTLSRLNSSGVRIYLRQSALQYFINNIREGIVFSYRDLISKSFGTSDFYVIRDWLLEKRLIRKVVSGYIVDSISAIKNLWNLTVLNSMMLRTGE